MEERVVQSDELAQSHTSATQTSHDLNKCNRAPSEALVISELTRPFIQVRITCLQSDVQEKSLPVDMHTTAHEVVCMLVNANNVISSKNTADVEQFCLVECIDDEQSISYKRIVPEREKVLLIRQKWRRNRKGHFLLVRKDSATTLSQSNSFKDDLSIFPRDNSNSRMFHRRYSLPAVQDQEIQQSLDRHSLYFNTSPDKQWKQPAGNSNGTSEMSKLMSQVVHESSSIRRQRRGSWSPGLLLSDVVKIKPLVCSPTYSAVRTFPEFVFTIQEEEETVDKCTTETAPPQRNVLTLSDSIDESDGESCVTILSCAKKEENEKEQEKEEGPILVHTAILRERYPVHPKKVFVKQSKTESPSLTSAHTQTKPELESSSDTDGPAIEPAAANLETAENSEMNLVDSLALIFDSKLNKDGVQSNIILAGSLISPKRRASLVSEASLNVKRKRSITHPTDQPKIINRIPMGLRGSLSCGTIISPSRREELVKAASEFIFDNRRQKTLGGFIYQPPVLTQEITDDEVESDIDETVSETPESSAVSLFDDTFEEDELTEKSPLTKLMLRRHRSERSKSRLFSFFNRKGGGKPEGGEKNGSLLGSPFKRSRSVNFRKDKK